MKRLLYITGIFAMLSMMSFMNDFFSSMTKADYVEASRTLKFTTKMSTSHVAEAIKVKQNMPNFEGELQRYVNRNFDVVINGSPSSLTFTGAQVNGESVWVYFEARGVSDIKSLRVKNAILMDAFPRQNNILNVAYKGQQKTMSFQRGREVSEINF